MRTVLKKCIKCKMHKTNKDNYKLIPSGRYSKVCNDCRKQRLMKPTQKEVKELLNYNPLNGTVTNKKGRNVLFYDKTNNNVLIRVNGKRYIASNIIWMYMNGYYPKMISHINGNKQDLTFTNLTNKRLTKVKKEVVKTNLETNLTPHEVLAIAKEQEAKKKLVRVPIFKGYKLCEMK